MVGKKKITEAELKAMIMRKIRERPEFRNIRDVAIIRPPQQAPYHPNWDFAWIVDGAAPRPASADEIVRKLQNQLDLT
jgi:hypothetical protein